MKLEDLTINSSKRNGQSNDKKPDVNSKLIEWE